MGSKFGEWMIPTDYYTCKSDYPYKANWTFASALAMVQLFFQFMTHASMCALYMF